MRIKKKKGTTLVAIIVIASIVLTLSAAMLSLATQNVRMRANESKRLQNLYEAESGLDTVYNIISKLSEAAVEKARTQIIGGYINPDRDHTDDVIYETYNDAFRNLFIQALWNEAGTSNTNINYNSASYESDTNQEENYRLFYAINEFEKYSYTYDETNNTGTWNSTAVQKETNNSIRIVSATYNPTNKVIELVLESSFTTISDADAAATGKFQNKRTVQATYKIEAPNFKDIITRRNRTDNIPDVQKIYDKLITASGNVTIKGNTTLNGDVWVEGNEDNINRNNVVYSKYANGIIIGDDSIANTQTSNVAFNGNVYTDSSLVLSNLSTVNIRSRQINGVQYGGNVYAKNVYIGPSESTRASSGNILNVVNNVITNNDFTINSTNSQAIMNNYYGINDRSDNTTLNGKATRSSSIIVNRHDASTLRVSNDAYIMGFSYVDVTDENGNTGYKTGESVGVKGNYKAYTEVLPAYENNVNLRTYTTLNNVQLNLLDGEIDKSQYFTTYYNYYNNRGLDDGGVYLNNVHSVGTSVYKENEVTTTKTASNISLQGTPDIVLQQRRAYAKEVFRLGEDLTETQEINYYNEGSVSRGINNIFNFDGIDHIYVGASEGIGNDPLNQGAYRQAKLVLNNVSAYTTHIYWNKIVLTDENGDEISRTEVTGNLDTIVALIITRGNVVVHGKVNFVGNIISDGNVELAPLDVSQDEGNPNTSQVLTNNEDITKALIGLNYREINGVRGRLYNVFRGDTTTTTQVVNTGDEIEVNSNNTNGYNVEEYIFKGLWKLMK